MNRCPGDLSGRRGILIGRNSLSENLGLARAGDRGQTGRNAIDAELRSLHPIPRLAPAVIETRLAEWRRLLRQSTTQARTVLQRVLRGRLTFTPRADGAGYDFEAPTRFDKLFTGIALDPSRRPRFIRDGDRTGADGIGPEDTGECDYERLLEGASRLREREWRARRESNPRPTGSKPVALSI